MPRPPEPRATNDWTDRSAGRRVGAPSGWLGSQRSLRLALAVTVAVGTLTPGSAQAEPSVPQEAQEHFDRGTRERDAGRFAVAASEFAAAYEGMPNSSKDLRASVLFELVDTQREAFRAGGQVRGREHPAAHLCAAEKVLAEFIEKTEGARKGKGKRSLDVVKATELRADVLAQIEGARKDAPELDCATVEYPREAVAEVTHAPNSAPKPERARRKIDKPLVIAGGALTGFGLIMVGLMAGGLVRGTRAETAGDAYVTRNPTTPADDRDLLTIDRRGRSGNRMAIAGGVLGALALGTGVALLVLGVRGRPAARTGRVAVTPAMSPRGGGVTVLWRF